MKSKNSVYLLKKRVKEVEMERAKLHFKLKDCESTTNNVSQHYKKLISMVECSNLEIKRLHTQIEKDKHSYFQMGLDRGMCLRVRLEAGLLTKEQKEEIFNERQESKESSQTSV